MKTLLRFTILVSSLCTLLLAIITMFAVLYGIVGNLDLGNMLPDIVWRNIVFFLTGCALLVTSVCGLQIVDLLKRVDE